MNTQFISDHIYLEKGTHRDAAVIWLVFYGRYDWLASIKTLADARYSKTMRRWYIPYDKSSYARFKALGIPFRYSETHTLASGGQRSVESAVVMKEVPASKRYDDIGISDPQPGRGAEVGHSASPSTGMEVAGIHDEIKVSWSGKGFVIKMPYKKAHIEQVKVLEGSWWNSKYKVWQAKGSVKNIEKMQQAWHIWSEREYARWLEMISTSQDPCRVEIYRNPRYEGKVCVQLKGYGANHAMIKRQSCREFHKETQTYVIMYNHRAIEELVEAYRSLGYIIVNRLDAFCKIDHSHESISKRVANLIDKMPLPLKEQLSEYAYTLMRHGYGVKTIKMYTGKLCHLLQWAGKCSMKEITTQEVNRMMVELARRGAGYETLNCMQSAVGAYVRMVNWESDIEIEKIKRPKKSKRLPTFLSQEEVERIISSIDNIKHLSIVYILYGCGVRRAELLNIKLSDVYWERNQIMIRSGKGRKDRMVNMSAYAKGVLSAYFDQYKPVNYLFESQQEGKPYSGSSVSAILRNAARKANIDKKVTPHVMRHSFATHLVDKGIALPKVQELLGHKDIRTTMIYTHLTTQDIRSTGSPLDDILKKVNCGYKKVVDIT